MESNAPTQWSDASTLHQCPRNTSDWQQALSRHQNLLAQHRSFLSSLQLGSQTVAARVELLGQCLEHVEAMMLDIKKLSTLSVPSNGSELSPTSATAVINKRPKKPIPTGPRLNSSGPFVTDTTPTRGDESFRHSQTSTVIRTKRRAPDEDEDEENEVHTTDDDTLQEGQRHKRPRTGARDTRQEEQSERVAGDSDETKTDHVEKAVENPAREDWFVVEVEEALRKKEMRRLKKLDRKRKRQSGTSDVSMPDVGPGDEKPKKKRQKGSPPSDEGIESVSQSTVQSGETTPQMEKGKNKRSSPAAEYISSILQQVQESGRKKRQRTAEALGLQYA